jgi:aryl-alcohol dehydrogenase-like predicted oxidoreductase
MTNGKASLFGTATAPSSICLGTGSFGAELPREESLRVLDAFYEAGGNFLDSAHIYAAWIDGAWGAPERTIGEWIRAHGLRNKIVLSTKGGHPPLGRMNQKRLSRDAIENDLNESLERLGTTTIDLYWLHRDDPSRPVQEIVETMAGFVKDGRIRTYGASNWGTDRIEAATRYAEAHALPPFVASQPGWALADRTFPPPPDADMRYMDGRARQWHCKTGLPAVCYSAQANGYFGEANTWWARGGFQDDPPAGKIYDSPESRRRLLAAVKLAKEKGCTANQVALAYLLHQPFRVFPIIGTGKPEHAKEAMGAPAVSLSRTELEELQGRQQSD